MCAGSHPRSLAGSVGLSVQATSTLARAPFRPGPCHPNRQVMVSIRRIAVLIAASVAGLLAAAPAQARTDPRGFRFSSAVYVAHESDGYANITITRTNAVPEAQIRYMTL